MKNETEFKSAFKRSVRAQKGFCLSLAAPMIVGIPDLYVVINGFIPVLLEAKWLGDVKREKFSRKINYSEIQKKWIVECNQVRLFSALGLVGVRYSRTEYGAYIQEVDRGDNYIEHNHHLYVEYTNKTFDVIKLFNLIGVPKVNGILTHPEYISDKVDTLGF